MSNAFMTVQTSTYSGFEMEQSPRQYKTFRPGDTQIPASFLNDLGDLMARLGAGNIEGGGSPSTIRVVNNTGQSLNYGDCVGIRSPLFEVPSNPTTSDQPNEPDKVMEQCRHFFDRSYSAVLPEDGLSLGIVMQPGDAEQVCRVTLTGVVRAIVDVIDTTHVAVKSKSGTVELESASEGEGPLSFWIKPTATGKQWCDLVFGVASGGGSPSGELGWGTPLSSMSPLNGAMVTKTRTYPESDVDRYRRDIVYLGEEWENCIVREGTPISYYAARPLEQLPQLSSATRSAAGLAKLGVVSPNYLSPLAKVPWQTSSSYFSMTLAEDASKYTINWRDNTNGTPRFRYRIDIMTSRVTRNIVSAATSGTLDWTLPDLFCLYGIPIDASGNAISDQYANSHAVFIDPSALKPKGVIAMYLPGGESEEEPANANSYLGTNYLSMYFRPNFMPSISQQEFFDLFTMECRVDEQAWTPWANGYTQSSTALRIGTQIEYNKPFEFFVRCTSRTTGRTQYTESMGWYIVTD